MKKILLSLAALGAALGVQAKIILPGIFGDNMVLQQQTEAQFWGKAAPGKKVTIHPSWSTKAITANADKDGRWKAAVPTPEAGGPYTIELSDGERLTLRNVLIGEVWLCSGQSNMEMPMRGFNNQPVEGSADVIIRAKASTPIHPRDSGRNERHGLLLRAIPAKRAGRSRGCHRHLLGRHARRGVDGPRNDVRIQRIRPLVPRRFRKNQRPGKQALRTLQRHDRAARTLHRQGIPLVSGRIEPAEAHPVPGADEFLRRDAAQPLGPGRIAVLLCADRTLSL